ncbi:hypothetical protein BD769DRAFT_1387826 [Suillus cothurnatus]|nr:hypothetical protein BD769DRAFT_1387826 [Suillus cothurnatus]
MAEWLRREIRMRDISYGFQCSIMHDYSGQSIMGASKGTLTIYLSNPHGRRAAEQVLGVVEAKSFRSSFGRERQEGSQPRCRAILHNYTLILMTTAILSFTFEEWVLWSPNPGPMAASSSLQDVQPVQSAMDLTTSTVELNVEQSSNTGIAEVASTDKREYLDPKIVNEKITHATKNLAGISQVPAIVQCTSSAANNLQSVSGTVDTFSMLLRPLKVFNTVANEITNVHLYVKVALSIFTCASKTVMTLSPVYFRKYLKSMPSSWKRRN